MEYHAHIYFDRETEASAERLRERFLAPGFEALWVGPLVREPRGPHPLPMFELNFTDRELGAVSQLLMLERGPHRALIHPVTGHDPLDHSAHAMWLGGPLPLDESKLDPAPARWELERTQSITLERPSRFGASSWAERAP